MGIDAAAKGVEDRVGLEEVVLVEAVGVGKQIEAVAGTRQLLNHRHHGLVELEDFAPDSGEFLRSLSETQEVHAGRNEGAVIDATGLQGVSAVLSHGEWVPSPGGGVPGELTGNARKIEAENDVADIE